MKTQTFVNTIYNEDAREILKVIPKGIKVKTTITSPPYYDMKDYGSDNQIGYGQSYDEYLNDLQSIFRDIYKITEDDGSLWIVIDTFKRNNQVVTLPFDLSGKLKEVGWLLQDIIIWKKDKTVPWSNKGFMQRKFEYILFFTKSLNYKSNKDRVRIYDTDQLKRWWVKYPERYNPKGKALDEVWEFPIPVQGSWGEKYIRHFCPLPKDMVATMIQISTDENDVILDPFAGSGTVLSQSAYMKREYIGFELNPEYIEMFKSYIAKTFNEGRKEYELFNLSIHQEQFEKTILELRALKYGRLLIKSIQKELDNDSVKIIVDIEGKSAKTNKLLKVKYSLMGESLDKNRILKCVNMIVNKKPLSKFGIEPDFIFIDSHNFEYGGYYGYTGTNSYSYSKKDINCISKHIKVISKIKVDFKENDYL